jgi:hypothetical protein
MPDSGIWKVKWTGDSVTVVKGEPFPPSPGKGQSYVPVKLTDPKGRPGK